MMPAEPIRIRLVLAAIAAITISGITISGAAPA